MNPQGPNSVPGAVAPGARQDSPTCPICRVTFANYQGRRVHERVTHPEQFHAAEAARLDARPKARWDPEEVRLMAAFEREHRQERGINERIFNLVLPHRSIEAIKGKRRSAAYKSLLAEVGAALPATPAPDGGPVSGPEASPQQPLSPPAAPTLAQRERETSVTELPPPEEDPTLAIKRELEVLSTILRVEVPDNTSKVQKQLEDWSPPPPPVRPRPEKSLRVPGHSRGRRRMEYFLYQRAWTRDRGLATRRVIAGRSWLVNEGPKPDGTTDFWLSLFTRPSPPPVPGDIPPVADSVERAIWKPVSEEDVKAALRATDAGTARGPDGRCKSDVEALGMDRLRWLFNAVLCLGCVPENWTQGRTVLIPKFDEPSSPSDFRPLTITPILTRILHRVLAKRLATHVPLPRSQKGFTAEEGCAANLILVREVLKRAKMELKPVYMAFLDFKKAFDSVGHPAIRMACLRRGTGEKFSAYVGKIYEQAKTDMDGIKVPLTTGVMQGDPLSPLLFNLTLDWALSAVPEEVGVDLCGDGLRYLAFADDVVLLSSSPVGLRKSVEAVVSRAQLLGLEVGHSKCATLGIAVDGKGKKWVQSNFKLHIADLPIRALAPGKFYRYLGAQVGSTHWAEGPSLTWASLGLPKASLKLMVVKGLEGGVRIYQGHRQTSGARVARAGGARPEWCLEGRALVGRERPPC